MGAQDFVVRVKADTAEEAFLKARGEALYEHGHAGYTGTVAEKTQYKLIIECVTPNEGEKYADAVERKAYDLLYKDDPRINDKWGPAGIMPAQGGEWVIFGVASS